MCKPGHIVLYSFENSCVQSKYINSTFDYQSQVSEGLLSIFFPCLDKKIIYIEYSFISVHIWCFLIQIILINYVFLYIQDKLLSLNIKKQIC